MSLSLAERLALAPGGPLQPLVAQVVEARPLGALARVCLRHGDPDPREVAEGGYRLMAQPGRPGVEVAAKVAVKVVLRLLPAVVVEAHERRLPPRPFEALLNRAWRGWAAGLREVAPDWPGLFRYARLDQPGPAFLREAWELPTDLPAELVVYRGGRCPAQELAQGGSWTPALAWAAFYAEHYWGREWGHSAGAPVILRRVIRTAEVLAAFRKPDQEHVVAPGPWVLETEDPARILELAAPVAAEFDRLLAINRRPPERTEAEMWGGWTG